MIRFILTGDMPKGCKNCKFNIGLTNYCVLLQEVAMNYERRPKRCPLQDTTELLEALEALAFTGTGEGLIYELKNGNYPNSQFMKDYNKLYKALGGTNQ